MPKRPCALEVTPDNRTILCADKFGDVWALPLLGQPYETTDPDKMKDAVDEPKPFVPAATPLTVHTKKNRNALLQQQSLSRKAPLKKTITFEKQLVLGHVSLLTEILCAALPQKSGKKRNYVITSDRDEHIRVSRGLPQAFVIENYCLGHTAFISQMCLIPPKPRLLVSGGGDDYLMLWDWPTGEIIQRVDLKAPLTAYKAAAPESAIEKTPSEGGSTPSVAENIAVNKIIFVQKAAGQPSVANDCGLLVVALEG